MKLTAPSIKIEKDTGFDPEIDIFGRKKFGEQLANIVESTNGEMVIALDSPWGEGKSTFIHMWQGYVENDRVNRLNTIYFDAFANDYQKDPFLSLASEFYEFFEEKNSKAVEFKTALGGAAKSLFRGGLKMGVRSISGGILDGSVVDTVGDQVSALLADQVDGLVEDRLAHNSADKDAFGEFEKSLSSTIKELVGDGSLVFIIDELDRCRPDFALELLENIKHFYSVPKLTFILVTNRTQLEASVNARYGSGVVANQYLQKFVHLWCSLPRATGRRGNDGVKYLEYVIERMTIGNEMICITAKEMIADILVYERLSCRTIERISSNFAVICNVAGHSLNDDHQKICGYLCFLKVVHLDLFDQCVNNKIDAISLLEQSDIKNILERAGRGGDTYREGRFITLCEIIKYDLADAAGKRAIDGVNNQNLNLQFLPPGIIKTVCSWLSNFETL